MSSPPISRSTSFDQFTVNPFFSAGADGRDDNGGPSGAVHDADNENDSVVIEIHGDGSRDAAAMSGENDLVAVDGGGPPAAAADTPRANGVDPAEELERDDATDESTEQRHVNALTGRLEVYKTDLSKTWAFYLKSWKEVQIKKLEEAIDALFFIAVNDQDIDPEYLEPFVESLLAVKMIIDEKNLRMKGRLYRATHLVFGNKVVGKTSYFSAVVGVAISAIAFGVSEYFREERREFTAFIIVGVICGVVGLIMGFVSEMLRQYYKNVRVTQSEVEIEEAFGQYLDCHLRHDYEGCKTALNKLGTHLKALNKKEIQLKYLINHHIRFKSTHDEQISEAYERISNPGSRRGSISIHDELGAPLPKQVISRGDLPSLADLRKHINLHESSGSSSSPQPKSTPTIRESQRPTYEDLWTTFSHYRPQSVIREAPADTASEGESKSKEE